VTDYAVLKTGCIIIWVIFVLYSQSVRLAGKLQLSQGNKLSRWCCNSAEAKSCRRKILLSYFRRRAFDQRLLELWDVCDNPAQDFDGTRLLAQKHFLALQDEREGRDYDVDQCIARPLIMRRYTAGGYFPTKNLWRGKEVVLLIGGEVYNHFSC